MEPFNRVERAEGPVLYTISSWMNHYDGLTAGFTSRLGGVSKGEFDSLNCGLHVADIADDVVANRRKVADALGFHFETMTFGEQVHGNEVAVITRTEAGAGRDRRELALQDRDSFITNEQGALLCALFADCVPLYFYDPVNRAVGLAHAGWKGTVLQIADVTVQAMVDACGTKPENLHAAIGPSIGVCCYEVDDHVVSRVKEVLGTEDHSGFYSITGPGKYQLNLQAVNRHIMIKAGILPSNIELSGWCTSCHTDEFFSHRKEGGKTGRMMAWIGLKSME